MDPNERRQLLEQSGLTDEQIGVAFRLITSGAVPIQVPSVEAGGATGVGRVVEPSPTARVKRPAGFADNPCCTWDALRAMPDVHSQFMSQLTTAKEMQWSHSEKYLERLSRAFNMVSATAAYVEDVLYVLHEDVLEHDDYVETLRNVAFTLRGVAELNLEERDLIVTEMLSLGTDDEDLVRSMVEEKHRIDSASYHLTTASTRDLIISMQRAQAKAVVEAEKKILAKQAAERRLARKKKAKKPAKPTKPPGPGQGESSGRAP